MLGAKHPRNHTRRKVYVGTFEKGQHRFWANIPSDFLPRYRALCAYLHDYYDPCNARK